MKQTEKRSFRISPESIKSFFAVMAGSLFIQIFCWAMYSYFSLNIMFCGISAIVTAMLYHFLQIEEQTGLSRKNVFFASILSPFAIALALTVWVMLRHHNLQHLSAELDGVSPMTETVSLYAARLVINGAVLMLFAAVHSIYLQNHPPKQKEDHSDETK